MAMTRREVASLATETSMIGLSEEFVRDFLREECAKAGGQAAWAETQWRVGRVLSADDVAMIEKLLKQHDDEMAEQIDSFATGSFAAGREQVLRELGGQEFVDLDGKRMEIDSRLAWKRACIKVAEKQAELDRLSN